MFQFATLGGFMSQIRRDWLKKKRMKKELTQAEVALYANITRPHYAAIESGKKTPSLKTAIKISTLLEFEPKRLIL